MPISYDYYRIFYYVARYGTVTHASNILEINQSNVTRTIQKLEQELKCKLFTRSNRGVRLTTEGKKLYIHVANAVEEIQKGENELAVDTALQSDTITIGTSGTALHAAVLPILTHFRKRHPDIHVRISNHLTIQAIEAVKNGLVDFAVVATHIKTESPLVQIPIMPIRDILIGGPSYSYLSQQTQPLHLVQEHPLISLRKESMTYLFYSQFFRDHGCIYQSDMETAAAEQILSMIRSDLGIGFVPEIYAKEALANREVFRIPLEQEMPERQICLIENDNYPLSIAAKEFKQLLLGLR